MATKSFEIDNYAIQLTDALDLGGGTIAAGTHEVKMRAAIGCNGGDHLFFLSFLAPGSSVPEPSYDTAAKLAVNFLSFGDIAPYVDLLRNEKPLTVYLDSENPWRNSILSGLEPVGEGEMLSTIIDAPRRAPAR
jgi:hypothetical protein